MLWQSGRDDSLSESDIVVAVKSSGSGTDC